MVIQNTSMMRAVIELSPMINNEEIYVHYTDEKEIDGLINRLKENPYYDPKIRCKRFIIDEEIEAGLDTLKNYTIEQVFDNPNIFPEITYALDALAKLYQELCNRVTFYNNLENTLIESIASSYYDCMSGGASKYYLAMCRYLIEKYNIDIDNTIYPKSGTEEWYTIKDFLDDIKDIPRYEKKISEYNIKNLIKGNI